MTRYRRRTNQRSRGGRAAAKTWVRGRPSSLSPNKPICHSLMEQDCWQIFENKEHVESKVRNMITRKDNLAIQAQTCVASYRQPNEQVV